ncbi:MAG: class I lanthipeptide [Kofleriaceae bacterium]
MKKQSRKLNLSRETLIPLQSTELDTINGGFISTLTPHLPPTSTVRPSLPFETQTITAPPPNRTK